MVMVVVMVQLQPRRPRRQYPLQLRPLRQHPLQLLLPHTEHMVQRSAELVARLSVQVEWAECKVSR